MEIGPYSFEEYLEKAAAFHGNPAPGLILGGYMVELAKSRLPEGCIFDAIVETPKCLPDAVQLLTLCSYGNGWMKIVNLGRYAVSLYDKFTGKGVRVFLDSEKLKSWPEIESWLFKLRPKKEQDKARLLGEIRAAGASVCGLAEIQVAPRFLKRSSMGQIGACAVCGEAFPSADGSICRACAGEAPYESVSAVSACIDGPEIRSVPVEAAVGKRALHDMTQIIPGESKDPAFTAGQLLTAGDVCRLQQMGRFSVYVSEEAEPDEKWVHENEAALAFAEAMAGEGVGYKTPPKEGKITFHAGRDGLLTINRAALERFNLVPGVMCASRQHALVVEKDKPFAACRAIPLYLAAKDFRAALEALGGTPLFSVRPLRQAKVGILVTGTEVFKGLVQDKFIPIISGKVEALGSTVAATDIVPDTREAISGSVKKMIAAGCDLIITTAGLSVDPDDVTRQALIDAGLTDAYYGAPILPGAMTLVGRIGEVQVLGVPACALYYKTTSFDLIAPRLLANLPITRADFARMGEGSFCLNCKSCTFPKCPFGK